MKELQSNMPEWVGKVPYSHSVNKTWGYPTDCSGFVSWAIQADVGHFLKAYEYGANKWGQRIPSKELQYGDIITHVWAPIWGKNRCTNKDDDSNEEEGMLDKIVEPLEKNVKGLFDYLPGHVFFFDKWVDDDKAEFWAYESSEKSDQTEDCLKKGPKYCLNHHVKKKRKKVDKWGYDNCTSSTYGFVTGGAHRLSNSLLC
jgi:hypothetical protein